MSTKLGLLFLGATVVVILGALILHAASGPSFRAEDWSSMQECVQNIPAEWRPGSLEYDGAETACHYVHVRGR